MAQVNLGRVVGYSAYEIAVQEGFEGTEAEWLASLQGAEGQTGPAGADGDDGTTFTPSVSAEGVISWTNDGGKSNPSPVNIKGPQGQTGPAGQDGSDGAAATIAVGTVTTGNAGTNASVTNSGTSSAAVFDFVIPRGDTGSAGSYSAGSGISISSDTISVDSTVVALKSDLGDELPPIASGDAGKVLKVNAGETAVEWANDASQTYTAGTGIDITSNVISSTVNGVPSASGASEGDVLTVDSRGEINWAAPSGGGSYSAGDGIAIDENDEISVDYANLDGDKIGNLVDSAWGFGKQNYMVWDGELDANCEAASNENIYEFDFSNCEDDIIGDIGPDTVTLGWSGSEEVGANTVYTWTDDYNTLTATYVTGTTNFVSMELVADSSTYQEHDEFEFRFEVINEIPSEFLPAPELPEIQTGDAGKALVVNSLEDGVEWATVGGGGGSNYTSTPSIYVANNKLYSVNRGGLYGDSTTLAFEVAAGSYTSYTDTKIELKQENMTQGNLWIVFAMDGRLHFGPMRKDTYSSSSTFIVYIPDGDNWPAADNSYANKIHQVSTSVSSNKWVDNGTYPTISFKNNVTIDGAWLYKGSWNTSYLSKIDANFIPIDNSTITQNISGQLVASAPSELPSKTGNAGKILAVNSGATGVEWISQGRAMPGDPANDGDYKLVNTVESGMSVLSWEEDSGGGGSVSDPISFETAHEQGEPFNFAEFGTSQIKIGNEDEFGGQNYANLINSQLEFYSGTSGYAGITFTDQPLNDGTSYEARLELNSSNSYGAVIINNLRLYDSQTGDLYDITVNNGVLTATLWEDPTTSPE